MPRGWFRGSDDLYSIECASCTRISHRMHRGNILIPGFFITLDHIRANRYGDIAMRCHERRSRIHARTKKRDGTRDETQDPLGGLKIPSVSRCSYVFRWNEYRLCLPCAFMRCWLFQKTWLARSHRHNCESKLSIMPLINAGTSATDRSARIEQSQVVFDDKSTPYPHSFAL